MDVTSTVKQPLAKRFFSKVHISDGCWNWTASRDSYGYGRIIMPTGYKPGKVRRAHQVMFEWTYGEVPEGMTINHKCRNTGCVNPMHLEIMSPGDNVRDSHKNPNRKQYRGGSRSPYATECIRGHAYTPENVFRKKDGRKECRECRRLRRTVAYRREQRLDMTQIDGRD